MPTTKVSSSGSTTESSFRMSGNGLRATQAPDTRSNSSGAIIICVPKGLKSSKAVADRDSVKMLTSNSRSYFSVFGSVAETSATTKTSKDSASSSTSAGTSIRTAIASPVVAGPISTAAPPPPAEFTARSS